MNNWITPCMTCAALPSDDSQHASLLCFIIDRPYWPVCLPLADETDSPSCLSARTSEDNIDPDTNLLKPHELILSDHLPQVRGNWTWFRMQPGEKRTHFLFPHGNCWSAQSETVSCGNRVSFTWVSLQHLLPCITN